MPVRIRLQRHGKKGKPIYWLVAADGRSKRDGKFLEKLGMYNPNTNPATIEINVDGTVKWLQNGAQPSETAKRILSYKGALLKHHLLGGVRKGALTEEQAEEKFNAWLEEKEKTVAGKAEGLEKVQAEARAKALKAEKEVNEKRTLAALETETAVTGAAAIEVSEPEVGGDASEELEALETAPEPKAVVAKEETAQEAAPKAAIEAKEEKAVVETPGVPQPDKDNADMTAVPPVVEESVIEEKELARKAPGVEEVVEARDTEDKPKAAPSTEEE